MLEHTWLGLHIDGCQSSWRTGDHSRKGMYCYDVYSEKVRIPQRL